MRDSLVTDDARVDFSRRLSAHGQAVAQYLDTVLGNTALPHETERPERLLAAMRHGVLNGGKRFRPFLVIESAALFGLRAEAVMPVAAALEAMHCYSLVHDDLPAMDDDDMRRGQPTVHKAYDEATAILAGDALLTIAFDLAARAEPEIGAERTVELVRLLARASGLGGMAGGQMLDLQFENGSVGAEVIETIHAMKTGALLRFACEAGAVASGADASRREAMARFGTVIGLAFQLADDLLDVTSTGAALGKAAGKDARAGKQTLVALNGIDWARSRLDSLADEAVGLMAPYGEEGVVLSTAARFVIERTS